MKNDDQPPSDSNQAHNAFDASPGAFLDSHPEDTFTGSSGVLFEQAMAQTRMAICLTDPRQDDNPIVFANRAFRHLTGYSENEILGRNCRFMQGPETDRDTVARLREAVDRQEVTVVELLNYRKDGTTFWNALHIGPIYDDSGEMIYCFGSQWDVSEIRASRAEKMQAKAMARELSHRTKNMFSVIAGIVTITGRSRGAQETAAEMVQRIQALGRAYETTLDEAATGSIDVGEAIRAILLPYAAEHALICKGNPATVDFSTISMLGLVLHELADNAERFGAWSNGAGNVILSWDKVGEGMLRLDWSERGGPQLPGVTPAGGAGTHIVDRLLRAGGGEIERHWHEAGFRAVIELNT